VYGLSLLTTHVHVGGSLAIGNRLAFPNAILQSMQQFEVTALAGVPSTFALLLHRSTIAQMTFPSLRYVTQAGGPMPPALLQRWLRILPDVPFYVMYGATEASARLAYLDPSELPARIGSIGTAIPNVELTVTKEDGQPVAPGEVGEIVARGSNIMMGYWNAPEETQAALGPHGFRTGDLATCDSDGFLYLVGRRQDMLKVGGERVGAKEIEDVLHEHAAVHEAAVVGVPHELFGEVPVAFIALCSESTASSEDVISFCRARLPDHKVPARVVFQTDLPKSAAGKIDKPALRDLAKAIGAQ
jgi:acyl-CoA synthetase (AMP-forming)/AMP-acid ligase II